VAFVVLPALHVSLNYILTLLRSYFLQANMVSALKVAWNSLSTPPLLKSNATSNKTISRQIAL
jgi:hypothetical protein